MDADIIIIGAGPAGLITAYTLAKQGRKALVLEARDRIGGRVHSIYTDDTHLEAGAEFVHGKLPITLSLLQEAELHHTVTGGKWVQIKSGAAQEDRDGKDWPEFMRKLKLLKEDMTLQDFLERYFPGTGYTALKDRAIAFAEGYDSADASRVSAKALYEEWSAEDEDEYRIDKGYTKLMDYLAEECERAGCRILLSHPVSAISAKGDVVSIEAGGEIFTAGKAVLALPLGILQQKGGENLIAAFPDYRAAMQELGFGDIIKFVLRFRDAFWEKAYPGLGFLMSGAEVPTWWTQAPAESNLFTGWMAGRKALAHSHLPDAQLLDIALQSLAQLFSKDKSELADNLISSCVANWSNDPYTLGAYAYSTIGTKEVLTILSRPMAGCIYFAGEYMYDGPEMGTVEAAFWSGIEVARKLLRG